MKRFLAILLCLVMVCALVACNNGTPNNGNNTNGGNGTNDNNNSNGTNNGGTTGMNGTAYRMGLGLTVDSTVSPAEDDDDGRAEAAVTTCALLLDQEGKIISVTFDCVEAAASYNTSGDVSCLIITKAKRN